MCNKGTFIPTFPTQLMIFSFFVIFYVQNTCSHTQDIRISNLLRHLLSIHINTVYIRTYNVSVVPVYFVILGYCPCRVVFPVSLQLHIATEIHPDILRSSPLHHCLLHTISVCDHHQVVRPIAVSQPAVGRTEPEWE